MGVGAAEHQHAAAGGDHPFECREGQITLAEPEPPGHDVGRSLREDLRGVAECARLLVLPKGLAHAYGAAPGRPWSIYWVHLDGALAEEFLRPLGSSPRLRVGVQPRLRGEFDALLALRRQGLSLPHFIHAAHLLQALLTSLALRPVRARLKSGAVLDIEAVQALMREHLDSSLNLDELAAQFRLSRFHFAKTYRALTGRAPIQDFIRLKMTHACRLLDQGHLEVRQVAEQLGYADAYYFSRLFKRVVGMAPSHYRALHQG